MGPFLSATLHTTKTLIKEKTPLPSLDNKMEIFLRLKKTVLAKRPILADILCKHGQKSLYQYAQDYFDVNIGPGLSARQDIFLEVFEKHTAELLGSEVARSAAAQLKKYYFVSTADHHGPICNPYFLGSNLVTAITMMEKQDPLLKNVIVLSCGTVSVDNDTFPRGLTFSTSVGGNIQQERLAFFSSHERPASICLLRPYGAAEVNKIISSIEQLRNRKIISYQVAQKLGTVIQEVYGQPKILQAASYSDQITKTNSALWKSFFPTRTSELPNLLYLEMESLVSRLLVEHHLKASTVIHRILFDEQYHRSVMRNFDGIMGAFSTAGKWGTYLFWGNPKGSRYRIRMVREGNSLVAVDNSFQVSLTPQALAEALEKKQIIPSLLLDCLLLSFYYGLKCLGGFCQVNYLTEMKKGYAALLQEFGETDEIALCQRVQTKELGEDLTVAFIKNSFGKTALATGLDLILYGRENALGCLIERTKQITLAEAIDPMMPSFYRVIYAGPQRDSELMVLSSQDITQITGLGKKIKPCALMTI